MTPWGCTGLGAGPAASPGTDRRRAAGCAAEGFAARRRGHPARRDPRCAGRRVGAQVGLSGDSTTITGPITRALTPDQLRALLAAPELLEAARPDDLRVGEQLRKRWPAGLVAAAT